MSEEDDSELYLSDLQKCMLLLLASNNFDPIKNSLFLQKEMFLVANNIDPIKVYANFKPHFMGPYSEVVKEEFDSLRLDHLVEPKDGKLVLTAQGKKISTRLQQEVSKKTLALVDQFKSLLDGLSDMELLALIYHSFGMTEESLKLKEVRERKKELAISLYNKGKISLEKMAEIAGIKLEEAMKIMRREQ